VSKKAFDQLSQLHPRRLTVDQLQPSSQLRLYAG